MTLPESLARKALPCNGYDCGMVDGRELHDDYYGCCGEQHLPAVEAVLREAIEACMVIAEKHTHTGVDASERAAAAIILQRIASLRTEELPND